MEPNISLLQTGSMLPVAFREDALEPDTAELAGTLVSIDWRETTVPFDVPGGAPILVAVDFSQASVRALHHAVEHSLTLGRPLIILHVMHDSAQSPGMYYRPGESDEIIPMEQVAHEKFEKFLKTHSAKWEELEKSQLDEAIKVVVPGLPAGRIVEVAEKENASMIIMGNNGRGVLSRLLEGSVALDVVKATSVPVTVLKASD